MRRPELISVAVIAVGFLAAMFLELRVSRAEASGVSLARDWVLDEATAQPTSAYYTKYQSDTRYLKLTGGTMTGTIVSSVAAASDAFRASVEGAEWQIGPDTKITESGTAVAVTAAGGLSSSGVVTANNGITMTASGFNINNAGGYIGFNGTTQGSIVASAIAAASASTTPATAAHRLYPENALDAADLVLNIGNAANAASLFAVEYSGLPLAPTYGAGTAGSGTGLTANYTGAIAHRVHTFTIDEAALTAAAGTEDETPWTVPAKTRLLRIAGHVTAAFAGPSITDVKLMCGTSGGSAVYLVSQDVDVLNAALGDVAADIGTSLTAATVADIPSMTATQAIVCRFTCTGANCSVMNAGSVTLFFEHLVYP